MTSRPLQPRHDEHVDTASNGEVVQDERDDASGRAPDPAGAHRGDEVVPEWGDRDGRRGAAAGEGTPERDSPED